MLSLGMLFPLASVPTVKNHVVALARAVKPAPHTVRLVRNGTDQEVRTNAATVAALLQEQGIAPGPDDAVAPALETPLEDAMVVSYRAAFPVTFVLRGSTMQVMSSASDVGSFLAQRAIELGPNDRVVPDRTQPLDEDTVVRIIHTTEWTARVREKKAPLVEHRLSLALAPTASKVVSRGTASVREKLVRYRRIDDQPQVQKTVIESRLVSSGKPKVVLSGIVAYERYGELATRGFSGTMRLANAALHMLATAYTANCYGCSGITAIGVRAGHGIVAVDPALIPLGTRLYIPGYGHAIAGDTGGAIHGHRIDLGFDSYADAMSWGTRPVHVYVLR
ncbi:MAG: DUF348 domain-containing protein [Candidatus Eremiobacteraeota bacterium]|nr:DUF348 domain-containing protein [Candidatus Eremiobacteraeota bacterium]